MTDLQDAIDGMSARQVRELMHLAEKRLRECAICGNDGADRLLVQKKVRGSTTRASLLMCPACFERHRLPERGQSHQPEGVEREVPVEDPVAQ
jgi:hypothetical protein